MGSYHQLLHPGQVYVQDGGGLGFASYHFHPEVGRGFHSIFTATAIIRIKAVLKATIKVTSKKDYAGSTPCNDSVQ